MNSLKRSASALAARAPLILCHALGAGPCYWTAQAVTRRVAIALKQLAATTPSLDSCSASLSTATLPRRRKSLVLSQALNYGQQMFSPPLSIMARQLWT